jgi:hypothetical protein
MKFVDTSFVRLADPTTRDQLFDPDSLGQLARTFQ